MLRPSRRRFSFFCAIVLSGWMGGFGPGILATFLSILALEYWLTLPLFAQRFSLSDVPKLVVFFFTGAFISWLARRQRSDEEALLRAREGLEKKVRERTSDLQVANEKLTAEIAERARAEKELHRINRVWRVRSICNRSNDAERRRIRVVEAGMPDYHSGRWVSPCIGPLCPRRRLDHPSGLRWSLQHTGSYAGVGYRENAGKDCRAR